jgi:hypothetical protein
MSPLRLNGSTSGYSQIDAPAAAGDQTFTLPTTGGTLDRINRAGNILQVVQVMYNTEVVVSAASFTDTGLTASITPTSASNKVLVIVNQQVAMQRSASVQGVGINLLRGVTDVYSPIADSTGPRDWYSDTVGATSLSMHTKFSFIILDSPATTSSVTYKTQGRPYFTSFTGSATFQASAALTNGRSFMTLLEVAA